MLHPPAPSPLEAVTLLESRISDHVLLCEQILGTLKTSFSQLVDRCCQTLQGGRTLFFFGNGGSAADAQHLAAEFVGRFYKNRPALPALALGADGVVLTATGNDYGFQHIFARQLHAFGHPGDVAIGLTTSGKSPNIHEGFKAARAKGMACVALTGLKGEALLEPLADLILAVPSTDTPRIQEMHALLGHILCEAVEQILFPHP